MALDPGAVFRIKRSSQAMTICSSLSPAHVLTRFLLRVLQGALRNTGAGAIVKDGKRARVQSRRSDAASRLTPAAKPDDGDADDPAADGDAAAASAEDGIDEQAALEFLR